MKQLVLQLHLCLLTLIGIAQTPVAYYPFTGNANDAVGTLNGTVNGATLTTDRFGSANSAYSFDGVNDFIGLNGSFNGFTQITVSAWYKVTGTSSDFQAIVSSDNSGKLVHMQMLTTAPTVNAVYNDGNGAILLNAPIAVKASIEPNKVIHPIKTIGAINIAKAVGGKGCSINRAVKSTYCIVSIAAKWVIGNGCLCYTN